MSRSILSSIVFGCMVATVGFPAAHAEAEGAGKAVLPKYQEECAACHIAYPAGMLPAPSWHRLMGSLNKHFGVDASLDEVSLKEISGWLNSNAGTFRRVSAEPPQDRITQSAWFLRQHNEREISPAVWKRVAVGSASNCAACHAHAEKGDFNERDVRIPR